MKKLLLTSAFLSTFILISQAQNDVKTDSPALNGNETATKKNKKDPTPEQAAQRQSTRVADELGLSAEQKQKFYDYSLTRINAIRPLKQQLDAAADGDKKKIHKQIKSQRETFDKNVKGMLSPEQVTKWDAQKAKNKANKESEDNLD